MQKYEDFQYLQCIILSIPRKDRGLSWADLFLSVMQDLEGMLKFDFLFITGLWSLFLLNLPIRPIEHYTSIFYFSVLVVRSCLTFLVAHFQVNCFISACFLLLYFIDDDSIYFMLLAAMCVSPILKMFSKLTQNRVFLA